MVPKLAAWVALVSLLTACGGGGGGSTPPPGGGPTATPTPAPSSSPSGSNSTNIVVGSTAQTLTFTTTTGVVGQIGIPPASGTGGTVTATIESTLPSTVPALQGLVRGGPRTQIVVRSTKSANATAVLGYFVFTVSPSFTISASPSFAFVLPTTIPTSGYSYYAAFYDGSSWQDTYLTGGVSGSTLTYPSNLSPISLVAGKTYAFAFYQTASGSGGSSPSPVPTPAPTTSAQQQAAFDCPTSDSTSEPTSAVARTAMTRHFVRNQNAAATASSATRISVVYNASSFKAPAGARAVTPQESALGAGFITQMALAKDNRIMRVLSVPSGTAASVAATLRRQAGVVSVGVSGQKRHAMSVTTPYYTTDPYFQGFTSAQNVTAGNSSAAQTFEQLPYVENANVPGQWDMHAIQLEHAFAYSQPSNGSNVVNANALGSSSVHIAIIDTGEDANHPELASKIVRQRCFITNEAETAQSTGNFTLDQDGHGTDVSGIAADDTNNTLGFTGAGGNVSIYAYRVFPTPDDNCANPDSSDPQCGADTADIASAITDAVNNGAQVISMSLGGGGGTGNSGCTNGVDSDSTEQTAITYALNHNVIVVAAAGNSGTSGEGVAAPGCDSGVIAVGATGLDDGTGNGSGIVAGGTSTAPVEYVANYSQYGSPANNPNSSSAWGIVAPGGDPTGDMDADFLHWVFNIWTTTPYESSASDQNFIGTCSPDYPNWNGTTGTIDCTTLIAGTSMATPHVAGAVALILSVSSAYNTPALMKGLLCSTADNLSVNGSTPNEGCGRLNIYRAMATALGDSSPPASNARNATR